MFFDGLMNLVSGLSKERAKRVHSEYVLDELPVDQIEAAYRTSAIARKIVDIPADDTVREWREWQAKAKQITALEAEEKRLGLVSTVRTAGKMARLYGGAAIYIGTGSKNPEEPLSPDSIRKGGIEYLTVFSRYQVAAQELQLDPRLPGYGKPQNYMLEGVTIHPSRLVIFRGPERPNALATDGWGDSVLQSMMAAVKAVDAIAANIEEMTFEAKVDVIGIPDFMEGLRSGGAAYEKLVTDRLRLSMQAKGITGALVMDEKEEYVQKELTFGSLPDIWDRFMIRTAAEADIPVTRLWGRSPAGLSATGESDEKNYHAKVKAIQTGEYEPAMSVLDDCLIRSALGARPDDVFYTWRPLWQPTAKERAENGKATAETFKALYEMTELPPEALDEAVVNALTETGVAPGLEGLVAKYLATEDTEFSESDQEGR